MRKSGAAWQRKHMICVYRAMIFKPLMTGHCRGRPIWESIKKHTTKSIAGDYYKKWWRIVGAALPRELMIHFKRVAPKR